MNKFKYIIFGLFLTLIILIVHLIIINDYSINWDFHHVFFAGLYHLKHPVGPELVKYLPFTDPDPKRMVETPFGPLQSYLPAISYTWLYEKLKILPFDSAFSFPAVVIGVLGIFVLFLFVLETQGTGPAFMALVFLALYPRYFGDLHTNVKDITTAVFYTISIWLAWRIVNKRRIIDIILGALAFGITFNFKVNAIFIPAIITVWVLYLLLTKSKNYLDIPIKSLRDKIIVPFGIYALLSVTALFIIWALFWTDPFNHLSYLIWFFQNNTVNLEVLLNGNWYCSGTNVPWFYPFWYLAIVTPIPVLLFFLIGLISQIRQIIFNRRPLPMLLLLWLFIPIARFLSPKVAVLDGIRHFEEVVFPFIFIAAIGASKALQTVNNLHAQAGLKIQYSLKTRTVTILSGLIILYLIVINALYHPYQLSYFNGLVGGLPGAVGKYDIDYWGISQKEAVNWINKNAPQNSLVYIAMSADTAGKYLRPDLLKNLNTTGFDQARYVVVLNRQSFFYRYFYIWEYFLRRKPVYKVERLGVPLTWVFDNTTGSIPRQKEWWKGESPCIRKYWISH